MTLMTGRTPVRVVRGNGGTVGYIKLVSTAALTAVLALTAAGFGILVSGSLTPLAGGSSAAPGPRASGIAVGPEMTVVSGWVTGNHLSGKASFGAASVCGVVQGRLWWTSSTRGPGLYSEQFDSRYYVQLLRTVRSIDGGKTFTPLASDVPISSMAQLADGSLVTVGFRTATAGAPGNAQGTTSAQRPGVGSKRFTTTFWCSHDFGPK